jgi:3-hydroxyacyl-[acyl-carrier-protein] dehydratase
MRWNLLDQILDCCPGEWATGTKTFPSSEPLFLDHFPGFPIVPGVLQIEMMAQLGGKCVALKYPYILPVLGTVKQAKFYANVRPEEKCLISAKIVKISKAYSLAEAEIKVGETRVSAATILFGHIPREKINLDRSDTEFDAVTREWLGRQKT